MRYAILSDIHSNYHALESCLKIIDDLNIDEIICLGDIIGYNALPSECIEVIRNRSKYCIMGNHDHAIVNKELSFCFSREAQAGIKHSINKISDKDKAWIGELQQVLIVTENMKVPFMIKHGAPNNNKYFPEPYPYVLNDYDCRAAYRAMDIKGSIIRICFYGHSHVPTWIRGVKLRKPIINSELGMNYISHSPFNIGTPENPVFDLSDAQEKDIRYIINPGAIGQPRNENPVCFAIFDSETMRLEYCPFNYNVKEAQAEINKCNYSETLAARLSDGATHFDHGRWK